MLSELEFKVLDSSLEKLPPIVHNWMREAIYYLGISWAKSEQRFSTLREVTSKLQLRWLLNHGVIRAVIEHRNNKGLYWLGNFSIGGHDPFILDCFNRRFNGQIDEIELIEDIVKSYLPQVSIVKCGTCEGRLNNTWSKDEGWQCYDCQRDFLSKEKKDKAGFVYIFGCTETGYYKIGCGNQPTSRMKDYERAKLPFPVEMLHTIPADDKERAEAELHRLYQESRTNGEWFKLSADDLSRITGLKKYVGGHWFSSDRPAGVTL